MKQADKTMNDVLSKAFTGVCFLFCETVVSSSGLSHLSKDVSQELLLQELGFDLCGFIALRTGCDLCTQNSLGSTRVVRGGTGELGGTAVSGSHCLPPEQCLAAAAFLLCVVPTTTASA